VRLVRKKAARLGYPAFAFDFRNAGDSQERPYPGNRRRGADVAAAVKAVRRLGATKVFSVGASLGGSAVLQAAANVRPPVTGVVSVSGAAELVDAIAAVRRVEVPAPYLADDHDTPFQNDARRLFAATAARDKTLKFIAGRARHPARRRERRGTSNDRDPFFPAREPHPRRRVELLVCQVPRRRPTRKEAGCATRDSSNREAPVHGARRPRPARALVVTWASGGNLPPLLAVAELLYASGFVVQLLTSSATRGAATERGFPTVPYPTAADPVESMPFEAIATELLRQTAGLEVARDVLDVVRETSADVLVVDCMLPAALAAGEAAGVPTSSVVHFPYALARAVMTRRGGAWTTDRASLDDTRRALGLQPTAGNIAAWESPELLLVTLPRWFDEPAELPPHVVHAGPLGTRRGNPEQRAGRRRALLSFSTTVMIGQERVVANTLAALELAGADGVLTRGPAVPRSALPAVRGLEILDWADHDDVMPACDVVVTHGGLGTTLRALAHGRPLLVLPLGRDQHFNGSRVAQLGAGLTLPADASVTAIASALERLFARSTYRESAAKIAAQIALDDPDGRAAKALRSLVT